MLNLLNEFHTWQSLLREIKGLEVNSGWGIVVYPVIQAIGRPDFEDVLRTRSPGEVISD